MCWGAFYNGQALTQPDGIQITVSDNSGQLTRHAARQSAGSQNMVQIDLNPKS